MLLLYMVIMCGMQASEVVVLQAHLTSAEQEVASPIVMYLDPYRNVP